MERVMGGGMLPVVLTGLGVVLLYRILVRLRKRASVQGVVVVITGASSGLGKDLDIVLPVGCLGPVCVRSMGKRLLANLRKATGLFTKLHTSEDGAGKTSFVISNKPSSEEFIKECLVAVEERSQIARKH